MIILVINCRSSSIKYKLSDVEHRREMASDLAGKIGKIESVLTHKYVEKGGEEKTV